MSDPQHEKWVQAWRRAGARLEQLRAEELPLVDTQQALLSLADAFESALRHSPPAPWSGLIEQQRWFRKLRP
jgi:hypothetical protein